MRRVYVRVGLSVHADVRLSGYADQQTCDGFIQRG